MITAILMIIIVFIKGVIMSDPNYFEYVNNLDQLGYYPEDEIDSGDAYPIVDNTYLYEPDPTEDLK